MFAFALFNFFVLLVEFFSYITEGSPNFAVKSQMSLHHYKYFIFFIAFYTLSYTTSLTIDYWHNKPASSLKDKKIRRFVSYERKGFLLTTLHWLFRLTILNFSFMYSSITACVGLYEHYSYFFVMLALVMFFDIWLGLRRVFKVTLVQLVLSLISLSFISLLFTFIRPYNDTLMLKMLNEGYNPIKIEIPFLSDYNYGISNFGRHSENLIYLTKENIFFLNTSEIKLETLRFRLVKNGPFSFNSHNRPSLVIDQNVPMKMFEKLKKEFQIADILGVNIQINTKETACSNQTRNLTFRFPPYGAGLNFKLDSLVRPPPPPPPINVYDLDLKNTFSIRISNSILLLNDSIISIDSLVKILYNNYDKSQVYWLKYDENTSFQQYLEIYNVIRNSIYKRRDILSKQKTGWSFIELRERKNWHNENSNIIELKQTYKEIKEEVPFKLINEIITEENFK